MQYKEVYNIVTTISMSLELSNDFLRNLNNLSNSGLFALISDFDRKVYLGYSRNVLEALKRIVSELDGDLNYLKKDFPNLRFVFLEKLEDEKLMKIFYRHYISYYRSQGYMSYRNFIPIKLKVKVEITNDYKIHVYLVCSNNTKTLVGIFDNIQESDSFVSDYYSGDVKTIVYSNNLLTRNHYWFTD